MKSVDRAETWFGNNWRILFLAAVVIFPIVFSWGENLVEDGEGFKVSSEARDRQKSFDDCVERVIAMRGSNDGYTRTLAYWVCAGHFVVG